MFETGLEWIAVLLFAVLLMGVILAEASWLIRKSMASQGAAIAFVLITDLLALGIGSIIVFAGALHPLFVYLVGYSIKWK